MLSAKQLQMADRKNLSAAIDPTAHPAYMPMPPEMRRKRVRLHLSPAPGKHRQVLASEVRFAQVPVCMFKVIVRGPV